MRTPIPAALPCLALAVLLAPAAARPEDPPSAPPHAGHAAPAKPAASASPAAAQLEKVKALAGTWTGTAGPAGSPAREATVTFRVTGAGSAVVETIFPGAPHEMVTVYHLDGDALVLTHYCAAGNQPTMRALPSTDPSVIAFDFLRGSNMRPGDRHMHSGRIVLAGADRLETEWTTWQDGKPAGTMKFALARRK